MHTAARGLVVRLNGGEGFPAPPSSAGPVEPSAVVAADFDGDGHVDIAAASEDNLQVRLGNGDGTLGDAWATTAPPMDFWGIATGDVNGDGKPDVVLTAQDGLILRPGNGDGTLGDEQTLSTRIPTGRPRVADVDGDGIDDAIMPRDGGFVVWSSAQQAELSHSVDGIGVTSIDVADIDGNGTMDVVVAEGSLHVVPGDGAGGFGEATILDAEFSVGLVIAADIDGDGDLDVVSRGVNHPAGAIFGGVAWFENDGGVLQPGVATDPLGLESHALAAADIDGDGASDIVTMENVSMALSLYRGQPGPTLVHQGAFAFTGTSRAPWKQERDGGIAVADFDEDGTLDVAAADLGQDRVVLLRTTRLTGADCE